MFLEPHSGAPQFEGFLETAVHAKQVIESMMGTVDGSVLERIAKIMSYMRPALVGKSGKRLKRKVKLRMLANGSEAPLNGHLHGTLKPMAHQSAVVRGHRFFTHAADLAPSDVHNFFSHIYGSVVHCSAGIVHCFPDAHLRLEV